MASFPGGSISGNIIPSNNGQDLGTPNFRWDAFLQQLDAQAPNHNIAGNVVIDGNTEVTGDLTVDGSFVGNITGNVTGDLTGNVTSSGTSTFANLLQKVGNNIRYADQFPGANAAAKIQAALDDLGSGGGVVDARGFGSAAQTIPTPIVIGDADTQRKVLLLVDLATPFQITITDGSDAITLSNGSALVAVGQPNASNQGFYLSSSANVASIVKCQPQTSNLSHTFISGVYLQGHPSATVSSAILDVVSAGDITNVRNSVIYGFANTIGLRVRSESGLSLGPMLIENVTVNGHANSGARPVSIESASGSMSIAGISLIGGSYTHPGDGGIPIIDIVGNDAGSMGSVLIMGAQLESSNAADIGIRVTNANNVSIRDCIFSAVVAGTDCIKYVFSGTGQAPETNIAEQIRDVNSWTNIINDTYTGTVITSASVDGQLASYRTLRNTTGLVAIYNQANGKLFEINNTGITTPSLILSGAAPTTVTSQIGFGATTSNTATAGAISLPLTASGFLVLNLEGTAIKVPYFGN